MSKIKASKTQLQDAEKIIDDLKLTKVFMNDVGEFFTSKNLALNSMKGDETKILTIERTIFLKTKPPKPLSEAKEKDDSGELEEKKDDDESEETEV